MPLRLLASLALCAAGPALAAGLPSGGEVVTGSARISSSGNTTTIRQGSQNLGIHWNDFSIGAGNTVNFEQPGRDAIAVNRVVGGNESRILGNLNANGQVWLINPNGVLFGQSARVNVGGLVASTLDTDDPLGAPGVRFKGKGGSVTNLGHITAADGGYVAVLGGSVVNGGVIQARLGTVALGAGTATTLTFADHRLLNLEVDQSTVKALVDNRQMIVADGGQVLMTAGAKDSVIASVVNNTDVVQAQTVEDHDGRIVLLAGMRAGTAQVGGTLDASAPHGGDGGFVETSAARVQVADDASITTQAAAGRTGTWLVDPNDYTIAASGGDQTGAHLASQLEHSNVTIESSQGATAGQGDINVNDNIEWLSGNTLTLNAVNDINLDAQLAGGNGSALVGTAASAVNVKAGASVNVGQVTLTSASFNNSAGADALGPSWTLRSTGSAKSAVTLGGLEPDFTQYHAGAEFTNVQGTGNGVLYSVLAPTLTLSNFDDGQAVSKGYDGTTTAYLNAANPVNPDGTLNPSPTAPQNVQVSGLESGDALQSIAVPDAYSGSARGAYSDVVIDPGEITTSGLDVTDGNGAPVYGYGLDKSALTATQTINGTITQKLLEVRVNGTPTKIYNGTDFVVPKTASSDPTAPDQNLSLVGVAQGDIVAVLHAATMQYDNASAGTHKTISATFQPTDFQVTTGDPANYIFPKALPAGCTLYCQGTILQAPIYLLGLTAQNKVYDGTTAATVTGATSTGFFGVIAQDTGDVTFSPGGSTLSGTFTQRDVGSGLSVDLLGLDGLLGGSAASNYTIKPDIGLTANITPRPLTVTGVTANDKTYDATTTATLDTAGATLGNVVSGDTVSLVAGGATGSFSQANVGKNLTVTTGGFTLSGIDAGNYSVTGPTFTNGEIDPAPLTIKLDGPVEKTYDGTAYANLPGADFTITGWRGSDGGVIGDGQSTASYQQGGVAHPDAGTGLDIAAQVQPSDFVNLTSGTRLSNYTWNPDIVAAGIGTIDRAPLTGLIVGNPTKTYDGNANAALDASNLSLSGLVPGQTITVNAGVSTDGTYLNAGSPESSVGTWNVQSNPPALTAADVTAGAGTNLDNYILPTVFNGTGTILPKALSCAGPCVTVDMTGHPQRYYDGTTSVLIDPTDFTLNLSGFVAGQGAVINKPIAGSFAQKDAGQSIPVSALITQSDLTGTTPDTDLGNYVFAMDGHSQTSDDGKAVTVYGTGSILPRVLTATVTGNPTKVYNGGTDADISGSMIGLNPAQAGDDPYDINSDPNNPNGKGLIAGETLAINSIATASYDAADATDFNGAGSGAQSVQVGLVPGNFASTGTGNVQNYVLPTAAQGPGTITKAPVTVLGVTANDKVYDQTTAATLDYGHMVLDGLASSDVGNVSLVTTGVTANFVDANVARSGDPVTGAVIDKPVDATDFAHTSTSGNKDLDYDWILPSGLEAKITPVPVTITGQSVQNKEYDGGTDATIVLNAGGSIDPASGSHGVYSGDAVGFDLPGADGSGALASGGTFATPNANVADEAAADGEAGQLTVTTKAYRLTGDQAGNYALVQPTLAANIWRAPLSVAVTGDPTKYYDGSTSATLVPTDFTLKDDKGNTFTGIQIVQTSSADYGTKGSLVKDHPADDAAVGVYATLGVSDYVPVGNALLSNYVLPPEASGAGGHIEPAPLNLVGTRVYDGTTDAASNLFGISGAATDNLSTGIANEYLTVSGTGTSASKNVAAAPWSVSGLAVNSGTTPAPSGGAVGLSTNYTVTFDLSITPRPLSVSLNGTSGESGVYQKVYDGNANYQPGSGTVTNGGAAVPGLSSGDYTFGAPTTNTGFVAGEGASITQQDGSYNSPNVVDATTLTAALGSGDFTPTGSTDLGNYILPTRATGTGKIIPKNLLDVALKGTREYDGTTNTPGSTFSPVPTGVGSETLVVTGTGQVAHAHVLFDANTGPTAQPLTDSTGLGFANGTGIASNYAVTINDAASQYTITPKTLTYTKDRPYDQTTNADPTLYAPGNVLDTGVNNEVLTLTGTAGTNGQEAPSPLRTCRATSTAPPRRTCTIS